MDYEFIFDPLEKQARDNPHEPAVCFSQRILPYHQLWDRIETFARHLKSKGLCPGDRVIMALPNSPDFFQIFYGTIRAGGIAVPLYPDSSVQRLAYFARHCQAKFIATHDSLRALPDSKPCPPSGSDTAYIQFTSGSTGTPKGAMISHQNLLTNIRQMIQGFAITPQDKFISWLPACHDMGLILMTMVPFYLGCRLHLLTASLRNLRTWLETIQTQGCTFTAAPDFAYRFSLSFLPKTESFNLSSLRVALNAAEPVRASTIRDFEERFNLTNVITPAYGLAEATVGVSTWPPGTPIKVNDQGFVSVGKPFPDVSIQVSDPESLGEILVKSPANIKGYWNPEGEAEEIPQQDKYIQTGDLGFMDADGDLFVAGRKKSMVIQGGRNIAPREVEEILDPLPFVRTSAVIGVDTGGREGEQVVIFTEIKGKKPPPPQELQTMIRQIITTYHNYFGFRPGRVHLIKSGSLPFTPNRKLKYTELKEKYMGGELAEIIY